MPFVVGRGAVVHDVAIGRPGKTPVGRDPVVALASGRVVLALLGDDAGIDPGAARGRAVLLEVGKGGQRLFVGPGVAVDLLEHLVGRRLVLDAPCGDFGGFRLVIPDQVLDRPVAVVCGILVELLEPLAEMVGEPEVAARIVGRVGGLFVILQQPLGIGERAFHFGDSGRRQEE